MTNVGDRNVFERFECGRFNREGAMLAEGLEELIGALMRARVHCPNEWWVRSNAATVHNELTGLPLELERELTSTERALMEEGTALAAELIAY
jgi:hypothetical protein